jgi:hypothetical protein
MGEVHRFNELKFYCMSLRFVASGVKAEMGLSGRLIRKNAEE